MYIKCVIRIKTPD